MLSTRMSCCCCNGYWHGLRCMIFTLCYRRGASSALPSVCRQALDELLAWAEALPAAPGFLTNRCT